MENEFLRRLNNPDTPTICIGAWYEIKTIKEGVTQYKKLRAVGKYERFVLFENEKGCRECFDYWTLARRIV